MSRCDRKRKVKREGEVNLLTKERRRLRRHRSTARATQIRFCGFGRRHFCADNVKGADMRHTRHFEVKIRLSMD